MCAILDASVVHKVFGDNRPEAGQKFFEWLDSGKGKLVVGGKLLRELERTPIREWLQQALLAGLAAQPDNGEVDRRTRALEEAKSCQSDDPHVIALAQVSGARLLYSEDNRLQQDFKDPALIDNPRGKVYTGQQHLLRGADLCPM